MKPLTVGASVVVCLWLSACAGMSGNRISRSEPVGRVIDAGKVVAVNQWAQRKGATVIWINYPIRSSRDKFAGG
jgi:hypothetical protein